MSMTFFFVYCIAAPRDLHSFPTRRSSDLLRDGRDGVGVQLRVGRIVAIEGVDDRLHRSEEHTSELQSRGHLVCRLLLEKKKTPPTSLASDLSPGRAPLHEYIPRRSLLRRH